MQLSLSGNLVNSLTLFLSREFLVYNINKGHNADMVIKLAVKTCISKNILVSFLERHSSEVENMIFGEWNLDDAKQVWQEEAREDGREENRTEILDLIKKGYTATDIENHLLKQTRSATA
ncbi:MAG: hypothetical protein LBC75_05715 [Fibromonadaceae bacterium]|jgi:hypothetical protein|nr:hypothetical protein [Fibromonadaceae bacterium]